MNQTNDSFAALQRYSRVSSGQRPPPASDPSREIRPEPRLLSAVHPARSHIPSGSRAQTPGANFPDIHSGCHEIPGGRCIAAQMPAFSPSAPSPAAYCSKTEIRAIASPSLELRLSYVNSLFSFVTQRLCAVILIFYLPMHLASTISFFYHQLVSHLLFQLRHVGNDADQASSSGQLLQHLNRPCS